MVSQTYEHLRKCSVTKNVKTVFMDDMSWIPCGQFELCGGSVLVTVTTSVFENKLVERILAAMEENADYSGREV
jgi:hypothetical protein